MKKNIQEKINFSMPLSISKGIVNADADVVGVPITDFDVNSMYIEGLASTDKLDLDRQILKPSGFILDYFNKSGFINWNHQSSISPDAIIGEPVETKVDKEQFFIKGKLYSWSKLAKDIYTIALNLENDKDSDRNLGWSVEGLTLEVTDDLVSKMLVTNVALCFTPKNNDSYAKIVKGITIDEVKELRKGYIFTPVYSEIVDGKKEEFILNLDLGDKQLLVTKGFDFVFRDSPFQNLNSLEDIQKAIIKVAQGFKEGFISKKKKDEFIKIIKDKVKLYK